LCCSNCTKYKVRSFANEKDVILRQIKDKEDRDLSLAKEQSIQSAKEEVLHRLHASREARHSRSQQAEQQVQSIQSARAHETLEDNQAAFLRELQRSRNAEVLQSVRTSRDARYARMNSASLSRQMDGIMQRNRSSDAEMQIPTTSNFQRQRRFTEEDQDDIVAAARLLSIDRARQVEEAQSPSPRRPIQGTPARISQDRRSVGHSETQSGYPIVFTIGPSNIRAAGPHQFLDDSQNFYTLKPLSSKSWSYVVTPPEGAPITGTYTSPKLSLNDKNVMKYLRTQRGRLGFG
jgi:hypothetical protein